MQMIPFFPSLRPHIGNRLWVEGAAVNEEAQATRYEREHQSWRDSIKNAAVDIQPLGKVLTLPGIETDDEDVNDDSEDSDSHDDEDEETNDRGLTGPPQDFYSMPEDANLSDEMLPPVG